MQFCDTEYSTAENRDDFELIFAEIATKFDSVPILRCGIFPRFVVLYRAINRLPPPCPPRMTFHAIFEEQTHKWLRRLGVLC